MERDCDRSLSFPFAPLNTPHKKDHPHRSGLLLPLLERLVVDSSWLVFVIFALLFLTVVVVVPNHERAARSRTDGGGIASTTTTTPANGNGIEASSARPSRRRRHGGRRRILGPSQCLASGSETPTHQTFGGAAVERYVV